MKIDIGIDLDGPCYDFVDAVRRYVHWKTGRPLETMPDAATWHFYSEQWGMTVERFIAFCDAGVNDGHIFRVGKPQPDAVETMQRLHDAGHRLHIVTDRSFGYRSHDNTVAWLWRNQIPYDSITFTKHKTIVRPDITMDDRAENFTMLCNAGIDCRLFDKPWNTHVDTERRVSGWAEYEEAILRLADG